MKKSSKEKDKKKLSFKMVFKDCAYAIKMVATTSPIAFLLRFLLEVVNTASSFIVGTYVVRYIINSFETGLDFKSVALSAVVMIAVPLGLQLIINPLITIVEDVSYVKVEKKVLTRLYDKCTEVELACFENPEFYDKYVKATNEITWRMWSLTWTVTNLFGAIIGMLLYGSLLFTMDFVFIIFAILPLFGTFIKRKANVLWHKHTTEDREHHRRAQYAQRVFYSGEYAKELRLSNARELLLERYEKASDGRVEVVEKYGKKEMLLELAHTGLQTIITNPLAIAYAIFRTVVTGTLGIGDCAVVINSVSSLTGTFTQITDRYFKAHEHALFFEDFRGFMEYEPRMKDKENAVSPKVGAIKLENVSFKYDGSDSLVLKNISMEIGKNEKIALVGHNGAGKSTLVKLLLRLYDPTEGEITLDGVKLDEIRLKEYRALFSVVFQDFKTISLPVVENVLMRPREDGDEEKVIQALRNSGVYERIMELPKGIETMLTKEFDEDGAVLSVGQAQKVAIAHAFVKNAPFIILDEPSSALDPVAENEMYNNMMKAGEGKAMIFISHRLSSAVSADRIYMLEHGEVVESGTHSELMRLNGKYADMFKKQAQNYVDLQDGEEGNDEEE
ncbi:MAG: ABC transporter ATP-binding protein [Clostridia bacterium]|nr:ABC transporter ATP-binding protein [Clostridia bacterium]